MATLMVTCPGPRTTKGLGTLNWAVRGLKEVHGEAEEKNQKARVCQ